MRISDWSSDVCSSDLEEYFSSDTLWSDFEETLASLDTEQIIDECMSYLEPYSAEDWSDAYHHDYQYEVQRRIDLITKNLKERFTEWVLQLQLPDNARSEEHTSELQSLTRNSYAVFCLKKKKATKVTTTTT